MKKNELLKIIDYKDLKIKEILFLLMHTSFNPKQCFLLFDRQLIIFNDISTPNAQAIHSMLKRIRKKNLEKVGVFAYKTQDVLAISGFYNGKILAYHLATPDSHETHTFMRVFHQKVIRKNKKIAAHNISLTTLSHIPHQSTKKELILASLIALVTVLILFFLQL